MAAFSYSHLPPFLADSVFLSNTPHKTSSFSPDIYSDFSHQFCPSGSVFHEETSIVDASEHKSGSVEVANEPSVTQKQRISETSSMLDNKAESGEQVTQNWAPLDNKRKPSDGSSSNSANSKDVRGGKWKKQKKSHKETKDEHEEKKEEKKTNEVVSKGYIHVRARRGQATDSHSLAERVRREKISERMKMLQALVPGCDKVTGKALMLDEIINYVQSLQHQVEFLSMKLASLNPVVYNFELTEPDAVIVATQGINCNTTMAMPLQSMPPCTTTSAAHASAFSNAITTTTTTTATASFPSAASECPLVDNTSSLFQREEKPTALPLQDIGAFYWELDGQRQNFMNQLYGFQGVNLHSVQ